MRIRTAIFGVYVTASAVGFCALMWFVLGSVRPRYFASLQQTLDASARLLAAAIDHQPSDQLSALARTQTGVRVRLVSQGQTLLDTREPHEPESTRTDYDDTASLAKRAAARVLDDTPGPASGEIAAAVPVTLADRGAATLVLSRPIRSVNAVVWSERKQLASVGFLIAAIMAIAGWWIAARLTHSLERLTAYARAARDRRPVAPPPSRARELRSLAESFEEMREALDGRQYAERYTRALVHELKAPLTAIRGAAELLDERMEPAQRAQFLRNIRAETERIQRAIERLMELSAVQSRKALQQVEPIAARRLADEAVAAVVPAATAAGVGVRVEPGVDAPLSGDRFLLQQALLNLLQNAVEFSPAGSAVVLRIASAASTVRFVIEDQGPGIPDFALPRVFEFFFSLPRPRTGAKSTGMGLALVREIAELHGGSVSLSNRKEGGACAVLSVPAVPQG